MNTLRLFVAGVMVVALTAGARAEEKKDNAKLLMGKWEVTKADPGAPPAGSVVEFGKEGKMKVTSKGPDGKEMTLDGTYKVDGDKFVIKFKIQDKEISKTITIKKISGTELMTADDEGTKAEFKRTK